MTLEEAIERNMTTANELRENGFPTRAKAILLGIEALKWFKSHRAILGYKSIDALPGETEE